MSQQSSSISTTKELASLLIPMGNGYIVLPQASVAEIVPYSNPEKIDDAPDWLLGRLFWRNREVPLVSFENLNGGSVVLESDRGRVAVLNGINNVEQLAFCAVVTQGVPRQMRVLPSEVSSRQNVDLGPAELMAVDVAGEPAVIPNIDFIESQIISLL